MARKLVLNERCIQNALSSATCICDGQIFFFDWCQIAVINGKISYRNFLKTHITLSPTMKNTAVYDEKESSGFSCMVECVIMRCQCYNLSVICSTSARTTYKEAPVLSYIASVLLVVTPDSMRVERLVSLYNDVKTICRSGLNEDTINDRLAIAFKSSSTANWDPQPAVAKFLTVKKQKRDSSRHSDL